MRGAALVLICAVAVVHGKRLAFKNYICPQDYSIDRLFPHENCNEFYQCVNGYLVARKCAENLQFNVETQQCDWPDRVECDDRDIGGDGNDGDDGSDDSSNGGNDDPSEAPTICTAEGSDGILVAHESCNKFYKCYRGFPVTFRCPLNLLYNPRKEQCDWPENVKCGNRVIPDGDGGNGDGGNGDGGSGGGSDNNNNGGNDNPSEAPTICAAEGSDGILVAHEDCNKFYKCSEGRPVTIPCPQKLLYNPKKEQCDWPENVNCGNRVIPDDDGGNDGGGNGGGGVGDGGNDGGSDNNNNGGNDNPSEAPTICAAEGSDGILVAHEDCNKFYKCSEGRPVTIPCPSNLLYNPKKEQCDWPENVNCGNRVIPEEDGGSDGGDNGGGGSDNNNNGGNDNPSEAPSICAAEGSDGILVAHEDCNKFYKCSEGRPVTIPCPQNLLYNPKKEQCDWPENVNCGNRVIPDNDGGNDGGGNDGGGVGDGGNDGDSDNNNNGGNDNPSEAPTICAAEGSDGILVAHEDCNKFYKCSEGRPVTIPCPSNLLYNPKKEQCDWPENVNCGNRIIPDDEGGDNGGGGNDGGSDNDNNNGGNDNPSEAPTICAAEGSDGILIAHEQCNKFYKCSEGRPVALPCPLNLLYNPQRKACDWPENVKCGDRIIPDGDGGNGGGNDGDNSVGDDGGSDDNSNAGNDNPSEAPSICAAEGSDGILVAHEDCNKFYKCSEGRPVTIPCPSNLLYNPKKEQCDWPENVNCGNRVIPEEDGGSDGGDNGGGDSDNNNNGGNDNPSEAPTICAAEGSDGILVAHEDCNKFYKCSEGRPVTIPCPQNLLYNPKKEQCDWPENVNCGNRIIPEGDGVDDEGDNSDGGSDDNNNTGNDDPSAAPTICAAEGSDGILVAHELCNKFYKCFTGFPLAFNCPSNLLYNPRKEQCDWSENVACGDRTVF